MEKQEVVITVDKKVNIECYSENKKVGSFVLDKDKIFVKYATQEQANGDLVEYVYLIADNATFSLKTESVGLFGTTVSEINGKKPKTQKELYDALSEILSSEK